MAHKIDFRHACSTDSGRKKSPGTAWCDIPGLADSAISERNVVIKAVVTRHLLRLLGRRRLLGVLLLLLRRGRARLLRARCHAFAATLATAVEQLHLAIDVDHHLGGVTLDAVLFPLAGLQSALDVELGALAYIFADDLRQA